MIHGISSSLSGLNANIKKIEASSNNLANLQTSGYKSRNVVQQTGAQGGAQAAAVTLSKISGGLINTGNSLDLSVIGQGFFSLSLPDGKTGYTRSGSFTKNNQGQIVDIKGNALLPTISVPGNASSVSIDKTGVVSALVNGQTRTLGQLNLSVFSNPDGLTSLGDNLFAETGASGAPLTGLPGSGGRGDLLSGFLEAANVDIARETVNMMTAEAGFKANIAAIKTQNEMIGSVLDLKA